MSNFIRDNELDKIVSEYKYTVGISLQDVEYLHKIIFTFMIECAEKNKEILYILIPRTTKKFDFNFPNNIITYDNIDCYNIILHCDVHCSLYSSCALEAPTLGIPNILVDIDKFASNIYQNILSSFHTKYVSSSDDFFKALKGLVILKKDDIKNNNQDIFRNNYEKNIIEVLKKLKIYEDLY